MIDWNLREHVVDDVVFDDTVEDVAADEAKVAVDGGSSSLDESPLVGLVVHSLGMGMVQVGDSHWKYQSVGGRHM